MVKIIKLTILVLILISQNSCGLSDFSPEYKFLIFQGDVYSYRYGDWEWMPIYGLNDGTVEVYYMDSDNRVDFKNIHYAETFKADDSFVFLYYDDLVFQKNGFNFPNPIKNDMVVEKLVLTSDANKSFALSDRLIVISILQSYVQKGTQLSTCKFFEPRNYGIRVYYQDYFASFYLGGICDDKSKKFGFRDFSTGGKTTYLFPAEVSNYLDEINVH